jgi:hypothetical protein
MSLGSLLSRTHRSAFAHTSRTSDRERANNGTEADMHFCDPFPRGVGRS